MNSILCTIAIPVYNRVDLIGRCVLSALRQADQNVEIVIVDNASTDGTWEYLCNLDTSLVRIYRNDSNIGIFGNFNRCLHEAKGRYIRFLCSDDLLAPGCLVEEINIMDCKPEAAMLSGRQLTMRSDDLIEIGSAGHSNDYVTLFGDHAVRLWFQFFCSYRENYFSYPSGILFRTSVCRAAGGFDTSYGSVGDIDFYFRVLAFGGLVLYNGPSCYVMAHAGQLQRHTLANGVELSENFRVLDLARSIVGANYNFYRSRLRSVCVLVMIRYLCVGEFGPLRINYSVYLNNGPVRPVSDIYGAGKIVISKILRYFGLGLADRMRWSYFLKFRVG